MEVKKNVTSLFIVPTLNINKDNIKNNNFINGYVKDLRRDVHYENAIYLLFKPDNFDRFREFVSYEYENNNLILDDYDYEDGFVVLVYQLNKEYTEDYKLVRKGQYSKTSSKFQQAFPKVVKIMKSGLHRDEISIQFRIFRKTEDLYKYWEKRIGMDFDDDMEVWEGFDPIVETLNLDKLKKEIYEHA